MVKHIILWQIKDELSDSEKSNVKSQIKQGLENLVGKVPGLVDAKVQIDSLPSSNVDIMLDSTVEDEAALQSYAVHPAHVAVKDNIIVPNVKSRYCIDYKL